MFVRLVRGAFDRFPRFDVASAIYPPFEPGRYVCVRRKELANWLSARSMPGVRHVDPRFIFPASGELPPKFLRDSSIQGRLFVVRRSCAAAEVCLEEAKVSFGVSPARSN